MIAYFEIKLNKMIKNCVVLVYFKWIKLEVEAKIHFWVQLIVYCSYNGK